MRSSAAPSRAMRGAVRLARGDAVAQLVGARADGARPSRRRASGGLRRRRRRARGRLRARTATAARRAPCRAPRPSSAACRASRPSPPSNEMPLPLSVRARIIVGRPLVRRACSSASRIAARSWPSTTIVCQPKARQRAASASMSCCHCVGPLWPSALTSVMAHSESSLSNAGDVGRLPDRSFRRLAVAEQHVGAVVRADAPRVQRDADAGAQPLAERSGRDVDQRQPRRRMPFEIRIEPPQRSAGRRASRNPASAHAAYRIGAAWPFDSTKRSLSGFCGSRGS